MSTRSIVASAAAIASLLVVAGCFPYSSAPAARCAGGATSPLHRMLVSDVLRGHGFSVRVATTGISCSGSHAAYDITNEHDGLQNTEGLLDCALWIKPSGTKQGLSYDLHAPAASPIWHGEKATFYLRNLSCQFYPSGGHAQAQLTRMLDAMRELARLTPQA